MELNATDVSGGTGIIEIDLVPSMIQPIIDLVPSMIQPIIDLVLLMIPIVIATIISVGVGTLLGYRLSEQSRKNQEQNKVQKVKDLLKIDFERLNALSITNIEKMLGFIEQTQDDDFIDDMLASVTTMTDYLIENIGSYNFAYWSVLSDSGHLIKLNKDEINIVYAAHFMITQANSKIEKWKKKYLDRLQDIILDTTLADRKEFFESILKLSIQSTLVQYGLVYGTIQNMDILWLDIRQLSPKNKEKLDSIFTKYEGGLYE